MERENVTLVWTVDGAPDASAALVADLADARLRRTDVRADALASAIAAARARGGVVAMGSGTRLDEMLQLGADEVAEWGAPLEVIRAAIDRARSRARWRMAQEAASSDLAGLAFMSAVIGHEIRNPLTAAMINCSTLTTLVDPPLMSDAHGALSDLSEALQGIADVVRSMASLTSGGEPGACDLARTLVELTTYVHKEVELVADFEVEIPNEPCPVAISKTCVMEVVASLLNNALFAVELAASRRGLVTVRLTMEDEMIVVDVTDDGVGMSPEVRKQAINPFFTTRRPGALGMGLTFAAMHVRRVGGEILLDSHVGEGTSVRIFLPRIQEPRVAGTLTN